MALEPLTEEEITTLAREIVTNVVYWPPDQDAAECSFAIMKLAEFDEDTVKNVGWVCERYDKAGPRSVNGWPAFFSFRLIHKDSLEPLFAKIREMDAALNGVGGT